MKLDAFRQIIREEVKKAIKEELQEVLQEAVKAASEPTPQQETQGKPVNTFQPISGGQTTDPVQAMLEQTRQELKEGLIPPVQLSNTEGINQPWATAPNTGKTQAMASQLGMTGPQPGLDLNQLGFLGRATKVAKALDKKQ